ncbi:MAG: hypothetical protein DRP70_02115 [Spirochaetes bacterium]|nr:MAG: hypothetical protein DRP70_02115 [Spirochaetota bacterium]RKX95918.1 MAG: hypothetical protein DRZ90_09565 [Spirochaetota bacterium]
MKIISVFLLFLIPVLGWSQSFDSVVNFDLELSTLSDPLVAGKAAEDGRIVILEGLVAGSEKAESEEGEGLIVTLIGGEWIGTSDVRSYSCRVFINEEHLNKNFSEDGLIPAGSRLLIAARVTGFNDESGIPEARMVSYRVLD